MKKTATKKRIIAVLLNLALLIGVFSGLTSCANVNEAEVLKAFKELYPKSEAINEILYGDGLPCEEAYGYEGYGKVTDEAPYKTEKELKEAVLTVYSTDYYNSSLKYVLFGTQTSDTSATASGARYRNGKDGKLEVFTEYVKFSDLNGKCIVDEAKVEQTWPSIVVSVPVEFDGVRGKNRHEVTMIQEANGSWRFDTISQVGSSVKDDNVVLSEFKKLYAASQDINDIIFGAGLPYDGEYDTSSLEAPYYVPVSESSPYKTRSELETAIKTVYGKDFFDDTIFTAIYGNSQISSSYGRYKEINGVLNVNVCAGVKYPDMVRDACNLDLAEVVDITLSTAKITVPYASGSDTLQKDVFMIKEDGAWRLSSYSLVRVSQ